MAEKILNDLPGINFLVKDLTQIPLAKKEISYSLEEVGVNLALKDHWLLSSSVLGTTSTPHIITAMGF